MKTLNQNTSLKELSTEEVLNLNIILDSEHYKQYEKELLKQESVRKYNRERRFLGLITNAYAVKS